MTPEELEDWLNARPEETRAQEAAWIASRAAARVLPVLLRWFGSGSREIDVTCLHTCRPLLITGVAATRLTPEIEEAARAAALAAQIYATTGGADIANTAGVDAACAAAAARAAIATAAHSPTAAARFAHVTHLAFNAAADTDDAARAAAADHQAAFAADVAFLLAKGIASGPRLLWPGNPPARLARLWQEAKSKLPQGGAQNSDQKDPADDWGFWIDWYEDLLEGRPQNRALLTEIALIPDQDWEKGSAHVNAMIGELVEKHAVAQSFIAEQIDRNAEGLFTAVPVRDIDGDILANVIAKVADRSSALRAAVTPDNNALIAILPVLDDLDDTITRYSGNALRLHDDFREAHLEIGALLNRGELSPDRLIDRLQRSLETGALDCEGNSEACTRAVQTRVNARALNLSVEDQGKLRAVSQAAQAESDADLRRDLADDLEVGLDTAQSEEKRANAMKREGSRLIRIKEKLGDPLNALNDTAKVIKSADTVWDFVTTIWHWFI